ncbi:uncharacterized protein LOC129537170 isoform X2 [Moschus berezovskii]|uniref:uncharacterized protein LOC129537170 isoform X2 n=1 Tax=Moschus berezovskii TaxID=68408 RepID=UPI0024442F0F|nr:uncharacterized protein LOC129537170 isoform X2 [Moschus berezovskii]
MRDTQKAAARRAENNWILFTLSQRKTPGQKVWTWPPSVHGELCDPGQVASPILWNRLRVIFWKAWDAHKWKRSEI